MSESTTGPLEILNANGLECGIAAITVNNPQAFVITSHRRLLPAAHDAFRGQWRTIFAGTSLESVPLVILDDGAQLAVIDQKEATQ